MRGFKNIEYDRAIQKIVAYGNDICSISLTISQKDLIQKRACKSWIIDEILLAVMDRPFSDPIEIIECIGIKISMCLCSTSNLKTGFIFKTAENTIEDVLNILKKGETEYEYEL